MKDTLSLVALALMLALAPRVAGVGVTVGPPAEKEAEDPVRPTAQQAG